MMYGSDAFVMNKSPNVCTNHLGECLGALYACCECSEVSYVDSCESL